MPARRKCGENASLDFGGDYPWACRVGYRGASRSRQRAKGPTVIGLDAKKVQLSVADLDKLPQDKADVKNEDGTTTTYSGVKLRSILEKVGVPTKKALRGDALQQVVLVGGRDGYAVPFTVGELDPTFGDLQALLVYRKDGKAIPDYQGPFRLLCPTDKAVPAPFGWSRQFE